MDRFVADLDAHSREWVNTMRHRKRPNYKRRNNSGKKDNQTIIEGQKTERVFGPTGKLVAEPRTHAKLDDRGTGSAGFEETRGRPTDVVDRAKGGTDR